MLAPFHLRINKKVSATSHNCDFTNLKIWNSRLFISHICHFIAHKFKSATFISHCDFIHYHSKEGSVRFLFIYCLFFILRHSFSLGGGAFLLFIVIYYDFLLLLWLFMPLQNISISNKCCSFKLSSHHRIMKKCQMFPQKYQSVFNIVKKKCFLSSKSAY